MVRNNVDAAPPSKLKRLAGYLSRLRHRLELAFSSLSEEGPRELAELQLHLTDAEYHAVVRARRM